MEKNLKLAGKFLVCVLALSAFSLTVAAQRKRATTSKKPTAPIVTNALEVRNGADKVSIQIKNVSKFIFLLGGVAKGIEDIDKESKTGKLSKAVLDKNAGFKQSVIQSIRNLRAGIVDLEIQFRTKPALSRYLFQIQGVSELAATAENQATGGQLTESGKTLLFIIERLSDTLAALP